MAEQYGWNHKAGELVSRGARNMVKSYYEADGKPEWIMSILPSGGVFDSSRDYAHTFVLFGLAAAVRSTEDERYLRLADTTLMFLDSSMVYHSGGSGAKRGVQGLLSVNSSSAARVYPTWG